MKLVEGAKFTFRIDRTDHFSGYLGELKEAEVVIYQRILKVQYFGHGPDARVSVEEFDRRHKLGVCSIVEWLGRST